MNHPNPSEQEPLDFEEAGRMIMNAVMMHATYPQGDPFDITITATDEEWNAIVCALQMVIIADSANGEKMLPPWMLDQAHDGMHKISDQVKEFVGEAVVSEFVEEMEQEGL